MKRRHLVQAAAAALVLPGLPRVRAQPAWPTQPVRLQIAFPAGGPTDLTMRVLAENASKICGQSVVVENRPGAGTLVAGQQVARAAPDGYTMMVATTTTLGIAPALFANPGKRPIREFERG